MLTPHDFYNSKEFEQLIARIHSILEKSKFKVTWNDKIIDPDNPNRTRQIDITIKEGQFLTIVECRVHKKKQDIKWIEELIGRRISLNADAVIAVSSSGFTEGAIAKASIYGIITRDFLSLSEEEIRRWGSASKVSTNYLKFHNPELILLSSKEINIIERQQEINELFYNAAHDIANKIIDSIPVNIRLSKEIPIRLFKRKPDALDVEQMILKADIEKIVQNLETVSVFAYGLESEEKLSRSVFIEKFNGVADIEHFKEHNVMVIDFSQIEQPANTIYHSTEIEMQNIKKLTRFGLVQKIGFRPNLILDFKVRMVSTSK